MNDYVKSLPLFDSTYFPCMYSGFVEVDSDTNSNLFYWFYRDEYLDTKSPLVLWINGGPGASSQIGNLLENGPLKIIDDAKTVMKVRSLTHQAWTEVANVLFLDQPVGTGYSYGDMPITKMEEVQQHALTFLLKFYEIHPEMVDRNFYITGESYGGKFEPAIATAIIDYNKNTDAKFKIPLKGVMIGNGYVDPVTQRLAIRHMSLGLGSIQFDSLPELDTLERRCQRANGRKEFDAANTCVAISNFVGIMDGGMDMYDKRFPLTNSSHQEDLAEAYLNLPDVVKALH